MNTISPEYLQTQIAMHKDPSYGIASVFFASIVAKIFLDNKCVSLTDYGAGKKHLFTELTKLGLRLTYHPYDPAFPEYGPPKPADLVCCIDVLEHVEPSYLDNVLSDLKKITNKIGFMSVGTGPAHRCLPDGRNAHLIVESRSWWLKKITDYFDIVHMQLSDTSPNNFWIVVLPK